MFEASTSNRTIVLGPVEVHLDTGQVLKEGQRSSLGSREISVLRLLVDRAGEQVSRDDLMVAVWGGVPDSPSRVLDVTVSSLRKRVEVDPRHPQFIRSVRGVGYQLDWQPPDNQTQWACSGGIIDLQTRQVRTSDGAVALTNREVQLLTVLAGAGHVPRDAVIQSMALESAASLKHIVRRLRGKLGPDVVSSQRSVGLKLHAHRMTTRSQIPAVCAAYRGRDREEQHLQSVLCGGGWVTLVGPPGFGKTQVALRLANDRSAVVFCDVSACQDGLEVFRAIARQMHINAEDEVVLETLAQALASATLLILDNCEQLTAGVLVGLRARLRHTPTQVLCTSRVPLDLEDEVIVQLGPLPNEAAIKILEDRASMAAGQAITLNNPLAIVEHLGAVPLALDLVGALAGSSDQDTLLKRLKEPMGITQSHQSTRHRSLWAAITASWRLLTPPQQKVFARSAVFRGGFTLAAGSQVIDPGGGHLDRLVQQSMLQFADGRFQHHNLLMAYAQARFASFGNLP